MPRSRKRKIAKLLAVTGIAAASIAAIKKYIDKKRAAAGGPNNSFGIPVPCPMCGLPMMQNPEEGTLTCVNCHRSFDAFTSTLDRKTLIAVEKLNENGEEALLCPFCSRGVMFHKGDIYACTACHTQATPHMIEYYRSDGGSNITATRMHKEDDTTPTSTDPDGTDKAAETVTITVDEKENTAEDTETSSDDEEDEDDDTQNKTYTMVAAPDDIVVPDYTDNPSSDKKAKKDKKNKK